MTNIRDFNYNLIISYDGTRYNGWQKQGNTNNTIQGILEDTISAILKQPVELNGSGRTDAGVHARKQSASFKTTIDISDKSLFISHLNDALPADIAVTDCTNVSMKFHARHSATGKHYAYYIDTNTPRNVFQRNYTYCIEEPLDIAAMRAAASELIGTHDFRSFCTKPIEGKSSIREIYSITIEKQNGILALNFKGNGFLYNMVRILSGTLVDVGLHRLKADAIPSILEQKSRRYAGPTLSGNALFLMEVYYD